MYDQKFALIMKSLIRLYNKHTHVHSLIEIISVQSHIKLLLLLVQLEGVVFVHRGSLGGGISGLGWALNNLGGGISYICSPP